LFSATKLSATSKGSSAGAGGEEGEEEGSLRDLAGGEEVKREGEEEAGEAKGEGEEAGVVVVVVVVVSREVERGELAPNAEVEGPDDDERLFWLSPSPAGTGKATPRIIRGAFSASIISIIVNPCPIYAEFITSRCRAGNKRTSSSDFQSEKSRIFTACERKWILKNTRGNVGSAFSGFSGSRINKLAASMCGEQLEKPHHLECEEEGRW
jgi:hypothetical protein